MNDIPYINYLGEKWDNSPLDKLHKINEGIYLDPCSHNADKIWRVVDAYFTNEDSTITYFRAYGESGEHLPYTEFGVNFHPLPRSAVIQDGLFKYRPKFGRDYLIPVENKFVTPATGGYSVCVLDKEHPSDTFFFGMDKSGSRHSCLIISFRLVNDTLA
jgi:hypothetical protein